MPQSNKNQTEVAEVFDSLLDLARKLVTQFHMEIANMDVSWRRTGVWFSLVGSFTSDRLNSTSGKDQKLMQEKIAKFCENLLSIRLSSDPEYIEVKVKVKRINNSEFRFTLTTLKPTSSTTPSTP